MSDARAAVARFVSGKWHGYFEQYGRRYAQQQTMEFADGMVRGSGSDSIGPFRIEGQYVAEGAVVRVGWIKTYDGGHSVLYLGNFDGTWIRGDWTLEGGMSDKFGFASSRLVVDPLGEKP